MESLQFCEANIRTPKSLRSLKKFSLKLGQTIPDEVDKNRLKLSFFGYLSYKIRTLLCLKKLPKHQIIKNAEKAFQNDMDIVNIITKLRDLEKLKILLLNEDQLLLFNYLSKPLISIGKKNPIFIEENLNHSNFRMSKLMGFQTPTRTGREIGESHQRVKQTKDGNEINHRLIELFDQKVCSLRKSFRI